MSTVIVLNADNTYIGAISWQKSIVLLYKGKVEMVKATDRIVTNVTNTVEFIVPKVVRLIRFIKNVYRKSNVPYSKKAVFIRDEFKCQYCGTRLEKRDCTVDHILPKCMGGKKSWNNCTTACMRCNNLKGDMSLGKGDSLTVKTANGSIHHIHLRKRPQRPSIRSFLRQKAINIVLEDIV